MSIQFIENKKTKLNEQQNRITFWSIYSEAIRGRYREQRQKKVHTLNSEYNFHFIRRWPRAFAHYILL